MTLRHFPHDEADYTMGFERTSLDGPTDPAMPNYLVEPSVANAAVERVELIVAEHEVARRVERFSEEEASVDRSALRATER